MKERAVSSDDPKMYVARPTLATRPHKRLRSRIFGAIEGAFFGAASFVLLFTLGVPWVFHIGAFDGLLPCMAVAAVLGWFGLSRISLGAGVALTIVLVVVAYSPIILRPARSFVRTDPVPTGADAVMVLSAGVNDEGLISPAAADRLIKGLEMVQQGVAPVLVVTREAYNINGHLVSSRQDQERIVALTPNGLSHMIVAGITHSTRDEALRARDLFRNRKWKRIVVVTSPMHTRRACAAFEKVGVTVSCVASDVRDFSFKTLESPIDRVSAFQLWLYETAGTIRYRQLGWI
ncbi:MAG TPA: YdcF family protein [Gemmatimonadaceae bacterium]|nr:YdcF family protein [Gemmatimonadaceae bacterium]